MKMLLLLIALFMLSGLGHAAEMLTPIDSASTCCPGESPIDVPPAESPCSSPDCPCLSCLSFDVPMAFRIQHHCPEFTSGHATSITFPPSGHDRAIEYPPEAA